MWPFWLAVSRFGAEAAAVTGSALRPGLAMLPLQFAFKTLLPNTHFSTISGALRLLTIPYLYSARNNKDVMNFLRSSTYCQRSTIRARPHDKWQNHQQSLLYKENMQAGLMPSLRKTDIQAMRLLQSNAP